MIDEGLAKRLQDGDRGAMRAAMQSLVERHYDALIGYLYRLMNGDRALAEDVAQETFLRLLRGIGGYHAGRPFKPYLYAIATNIARNHYTSAESRYTLSTDPDLPDVADDHGIEDVMMSDDEAVTVRRALAALPTHQREVIVLHFYQALTPTEIASALDIPVGTVRSRLSIGIGRIREWMKTKAVDGA